ncbi:VWA domain-containing protein [Cohnella sp. LGH]|uniref:Ca-activated chloride channel family protein n=1 Tax=Cohnella phaseoli TaxID=456490 RepID=A0A3D9JQI4_9BACL|nr:MULTISPECIES: vWA domain-containing protein [Cohnella]QTH43564.1 VWA domain-containing protein [Cohnella sp. LGH]RED76292.1 Ca-activated chloride channel family protein [Cohnella phaseoli]
MYQRKISLLLVLFSLFGGIVGAVVGEALLSWGTGKIPNVLLMGMYFGQLALWIALFCLIAELISPELNGQGWRLRYTGDSWKLLIPASLVLLLLAGMGLQFIYGLYFGKNQPPKDIMLAVDTSGSMIETDPNRESIAALNQLVQKMESDKRTAIITFSDRAQVLQPLVALDSQAAKEDVIAKLNGIGVPDGGTDIGAALSTSMTQIEAAKNEENRKSMVILISDGYSLVDLDAALAPYKANKISINTVGMNIAERDGNDLLRQIAGKTGGTFHLVDEVSDLSMVISEIYRSTQSWHLVGERTGASVDNLYYEILRIILFVLIGAFLGLALGIIFDNRYLAKSFTIGGSIAGLIAGAILEFGFKDFSLSPLTYRAAADIVLAVVLALSTVMIAYKQNSSEVNGGLYSRNRQYGAQNLERPQGTRRNFK